MVSVVRWSQTNHLVQSESHHLCMFHKKSYHLACPQLLIRNHTVNIQWYTYSSGISSSSLCLIFLCLAKETMADMWMALFPPDLKIQSQVDSPKRRCSHMALTTSPMTTCDRILLPPLYICINKDISACKDQRPCWFLLPAGGSNALICA